MNASGTTRGAGREVLGPLVALGLGAMHFASFFSDLGPGETFGLRLALFLVAAFLAGTVLGAFVPRRWAIYSVASCWGAFLAAAMLLVMHEKLGIYLGVGSLLAVLAGGATGAWSRRIRPERSQRHQPMP
jgi:hypothetical protein